MSRLVARLLLVVIMWCASSCTRMVLPMFLGTSELASRLAATRKVLPSPTALVKRLRTCTRASSVSRLSSTARNTPSSTGTLMVLAAWNHSSPR
jgi:hypothetical protein